MNDIAARRLAQAAMFHQVMRLHGTLWAATQVTQEKLDYSFVQEELMRQNGRRTMPLLIDVAASENLGQLHLTHLTEHGAWTQSARSFSVQNQTPLTQRFASMGRMSETINQVRTATSAQLLVSEHLARMDGITGFEEEPLLEEDEDK